ncbi:hypothetical protein ACFSJ3_09550 [Corallincola platygyrae]|uniref:Uncharacterized protein n=1 Tax=Corallincola platygyrae TaxID=1193278 RepID=A0ABW4XM68_9GAMM
MIEKTLLAAMAREEAYVPQLKIATLQDAQVKDRDLGHFRAKILNHYQNGAEAHLAGKVELTRCGNIADLKTLHGKQQVRYSAYACFADSPNVASWVYTMSAEYLSPQGEVLAIEVLGAPGRAQNKADLDGKVAWFNELVEARVAFIGKHLQQVDPSALDLPLESARLVVTDLAKTHVAFYGYAEKPGYLSLGTIRCENDACEYASPLQEEGQL